MSSTTGSTVRSGEPVRCAAVLTHGRAATIGPALRRVEEAAAGAGVELVFSQDEVSKHDISETPHDLADADFVVVLGGDGTMLRALRRLLGTGIPAIGVNFGRVGFLTAISERELDTALPRVFAGDHRVIALPTLEVELDGERRVAVNDVVAASATVGRMVELSWSVGRRSPRAAGLRRDHLCDSARLDRVQPVERRPGAGLGSRRARRHVHRASLAARAVDGRAAGARRRSHERDGRRLRHGALRRPAARRAAAVGPGRRAARTSSAACSRRSPT